MSILDFIKTKEQKKQESSDYFNKLFPYGEVHRDTIKELILEIFPLHSDFNLFFTYIVIKENHLDESLERDRIQIRSDREFKKIKPSLSDFEKMKFMILLSIDMQSPHLLSKEEYLELLNTSLKELDQNR